MNWLTPIAKHKGENMNTLLICITLIILCPTILLTLVTLKLVNLLSDVKVVKNSFGQVSPTLPYPGVFTDPFDDRLTGKGLEHELDLTDEQVDSLLAEDEQEVVSSHVAERHNEYDEKIARLKAEVEKNKAQVPGVIYEEDAVEVLARYIVEPKEEYAR